MKPLDTPNRAPILLIVLLVGQILLMSLHARARETRQSLPQTLILSALYPLQKGASLLTSTFSGIWNGYVDLRGAAAENERLRRENADLRKTVTALGEEAASNRRLMDLLNLKQSLPVPSVAANVIARDGNPWTRQITIDQGTLAGVRLKSPVITADGVVGRVISTGPTASVVQLVTDGDAGVGAMLVDSRVNGELRGRNDGLCRLESISGLTQVRDGEAVLTTGLDGIYPKGLLLGTVAQIQLGSGAALHQITVRPAAKIDRLEEVLVLLGKPVEVELTESVKKER